MRAIVDTKVLGGRGHSNAMSVVEEMVTATGRALLEEDFESFSSRFMFPHFVVTKSGNREVRNVDDLRVTFNAVMEHYRLSGVDRMERYCVFGHFVDNTTIECAHESRLYHNDTLVQKPFLSQSILKQKDDEWKIYSTEYLISDSLRYLRALTQ